MSGEADPPVGGTPAQPEPTRAEWERIAWECQHNNQLVQRWLRPEGENGYRASSLTTFDGTFMSLIAIYQTHKRSKFNRIRY